MMRALAGLIVLLLIAAGAVYIVARRETVPIVRIEQPDKAIGQAGTLVVTAEAPKAQFKALTVAVEQNGKSFPLFSLDSRDQAKAAAASPVAPDRITITRPIGKQSVPELRSGTARIVVSATRPSFLNLRTLSTSTSKDIQVRLEPPAIAVLSTHHYVNLGGSEMVVYRATPADVHSGVRVGDVEYPGFPASGAGLAGADPSDRVAFFALLYNQELRTPIVAFARDEAGNEVTARFIDNVFPKPQKRSRIELDDRFVGRVVPEILEHSPELKMAPPAPGDDAITPFLAINGELRRANAAAIAALAKKTSASKLWNGPFTQLGNSKVEAAFADHRTYVYKGKEVDQQVHLGFDLAVTSRVPIVAANAGTVLNASWLGIYGNCVIVDHGMGVQSLYGHLSSFDVKVGDTVTKGQTVGRSGMTGLAGGDHLHFTMLVNGQMVNPVEWWDPHWIDDRVQRKLGEAGAPASAAAGAAAPAR
jgi:murein DD-endopeptidase MepM/ murein hydrolase activator NlpD